MFQYDNIIKKIWWCFQMHAYLHSTCKDVAIFCHHVTTVSLDGGFVILPS